MDNFLNAMPYINVNLHTNKLSYLLYKCYSDNIISLYI